MSARYSKGVVAEELVAILAVVVLLTVFIVSSVYANSRFLSEQAYLDAQRAASTLVEKLYFESGGIVLDASSFVAVANLTYPVKIVLTDLERNQTWSYGSTGAAKSVASASAAMLILDPATLRRSPARLEVFVPV
ncbi:MAG: hypothetical protein QW548_00805 [Candidatus Aenigmatarchaeota archaeon]